MLVTCQCCHRQCQIKDIGSFVIPVGIVFAHHVFPVIVARSVQVDINVVSVRHIKEGLVFPIR